MAKLKNILSWTLTIVVFLLLIAGAIRIGKYVNYNLFYSSYVEERVRPLEQRIEKLESLMTNGTVRLQ